MLMYWAEEYTPMNFIHRLSLDLKTLCISVEEEEGEIDITSMYLL